MALTEAVEAVEPGGIAAGTRTQPERDRAALLIIDTLVGRHPAGAARAAAIAATVVAP